MVSMVYCFVEVHLQACFDGMPSRAIHGHPLFWSFATFKVDCGLPNPTWLGVSSALEIHPYFGLFLQSVPVMFNKFNRLLAFSGKNCGFCKVQVADQAVETDRKSRFLETLYSGFGARCTVHFCSDSESVGRRVLPLMQCLLPSPRHWVLSLVHLFTQMQNVSNEFKNSNEMIHKVHRYNIQIYRWYTS